MKNPTFPFLVFLFTLSIICTCNKNSDEPKVNPNPSDTTTIDTTNNEPKIDSVALIIGNWTIEVATGNGNPDPSTTGKSMHFNGDGSYKFSGSFTGTWIYQKDDHSLLVDAQTQYESTWKIERLDEKRFIVNFPSPWDGGTPLRWDMARMP